MIYSCEWLKYHIDEQDPAMFPCEWAKENWNKSIEEITQPFPCQSLRDKWTGETYRTVLYADGTFIINEKGSDIEANTQAHGNADYVYPAFDAEHDYVFSSSSQRYWHTERSSIKNIKFGSEIKPVSTERWFHNCQNLVSFDATNCNTSNVTNMSRMFLNCYVLTSLDLNGFDTSNVTNMTFMFGACEALTNLDVSGFDTSNVTNMEDMFDGCNTLTNLDVSNFNTSNVINMAYMFQDCDALTNLDVSNFNTSNVINMAYMFGTCEALTNLDVSGFDTSNVTNMAYMFSGCAELKTIYATEDFVTTAVISTENNMFLDCTSIVGGAGTAYNSFYTGTSHACIDNPPDALGYFTEK